MGGTLRRSGPGGGPSHKKAYYSRPSTLNCGVLMGSAQGAGSSSVGSESVPGVIISP